MPSLLFRMLTSVVRGVRSFGSYESTKNQVDTEEIAREAESLQSEREVKAAEWREECFQASIRRQIDLQNRKEAEERRLSELALIQQAANAATENSPDSGDIFYRSARWRSLRYEAFRRYGRRCSLCGRTPNDNGVVLHVDHIKPRSRNPELQWEIDNLQILCEDCNLGKGAKDSTRWR
ncbi:HNH endonuclease [Leptothrix cholodnii SP-6]|uniref:HNH endonuclease n=1 Tax=Leptothrix cholodnii (strain ATCC 51168 / LMG 8142 / SP-6) TaxID=395495 RepID=B1XZY4_LEPCP|nr:HNH endonuclease [Leptothrix cholodnii SP-6]